MIYGEDYKGCLGRKKRIWRKTQILFLALSKYEGEYIRIFYFIKFFYGVGIFVPDEVSEGALDRIFFLVFFDTL